MVKSMNEKLDRYLRKIPEPRDSQRCSIDYRLKSFIGLTSSGQIKVKVKLYDMDTLESEDVDGLPISINDEVKNSTKDGIEFNVEGNSVRLTLPRVSRSYRKNMLPLYDDVIKPDYVKVKVNKVKK